MRLFAFASLAVLMSSGTAFAQVASPPPQLSAACDLQPALIGDACAKLLDDFAQTGADPTSNLPAGTPLSGDLVMTSPAWSKAVVIRIGRKGAAVSMAWAAGASQNWDAFNYDPVTANAPVASAAPTPAPQAVAQPAPAASAAPAPATQTAAATASPDPVTSTSDPNAQATATPAAQGADGAAAPAAGEPIPAVAVAPTTQAIPDKLYRGWVNDVSTTDANYPTVLGSFFDERETIATVDMTAILPIRGAYEAPLMLTRTAKLVVPTDQEILVSATITAPDTEQPKMLLAENNPTTCSLAVFVDDSPAIDTTPGVLAKVTNSQLLFKSPPVGIPAGVHDVVAHFSCSDRSALEQVLRSGIATVQGKENGMKSYGYGLQITDANGGPVLVGVTQEMKDAALAGAISAKRVIDNTNFTLPGGYEAGWVASTPSFTGKLPGRTEDLWDMKLQWPTAGGQSFPAPVKAAGYRFDFANKLLSLGNDKKLVNNLIELDGIFTARDGDGDYTFALGIEPDEKMAFCREQIGPNPSSMLDSVQRVIQTDSAGLQYKTADHDLPAVPAMIRMENDIRQVQPLFSLAFCYAERDRNLVASATDSVSTISATSFALKDGSAYRLGALFLYPELLGTQKSKNDEGHNGGAVTIYVKTPKDKVMRPMKAYEIVHQVGG